MDYRVTVRVIALPRVRTLELTANRLRIDLISNSRVLRNVMSWPLCFRPVVLTLTLRQKEIPYSCQLRIYLSRRHMARCVAERINFFISTLVYIETPIY